MAIKIETAVWEQLPGKGEVKLYTLSNDSGMKVTVSSLGAVIVKLIVPDQDGKEADVVLGFDRAEDYLKNPSFFGAVIGPSANRIGRAEYIIEGVVCHADVNDGVNNLHSHIEEGYHKRNWEARETKDGVTFALCDGDGQMG